MTTPAHDEKCEGNWNTDCGCATRALDAKDAEIERLTRWIHDLQSGLYINCAYCGHRYGPSDQAPATIPEAPTITMADVLRAHIEQCPQHPMSALKREQVEDRAAIRAAALIEPGVKGATTLLWKWREKHAPAIQRARAEGKG